MPKREHPFEKYGISWEVLVGIKKMGFLKPTTTQKKILPCLLSGKDMCASARTGSGKTAAYAIPMIDKFKLHDPNGVRGLVLAPARELVMQIARVIKDLASGTNLVVVDLIGGVSFERQLNDMACKPDIIVASPGRLLHHLKATPLTLNSILFLVLDEGDRLMEPEHYNDVNYIVKRTPASRQTALLSATMPAELEAFTVSITTEPEILMLHQDVRINANLISWYFYVRKEDKIAALCCFVDMLTEGKKTIVFACTRYHVDLLTLVLNRVFEEEIACGICGSMSQDSRSYQLRRFRRGVTKVMVCTDVGARGLDISGVDYVVSFDMPGSPKIFLHRIGRTARAEKSGIAATFVEPTDLPYLMDAATTIGFQVNCMEGDNDDNVMGTFPELSKYRVAVDTLLLADAEAARLAKQRQDGGQLFLKTRTPASPASVRHAYEFRHRSGARELLTQVHPIFRTKCDSLPTQEDIRDRNAIFQDYRPKMEDHSYQALSSAAAYAMRFAVEDRMESKIPGQSHVSDPGPCPASDEEDPLMDVDLKPFLRVNKKKQQNRQFVLKEVQVDPRQEEARGRVGDEMDESKKNLIVRRWDSRKKRYALKAIDADRRVVKTDKKSKENEELKHTKRYDAWLKRKNATSKKKSDSEHIIGQEDVDYSNFTNNKSFLDAVSTGGKLTHKQERKKKKYDATKEGRVTHHKRDAKKDLKKPLRKTGPGRKRRT